MPPHRFSSYFAAGLLGGVLRFAIMVPLGMYELLARNHWNVVKDNPELQGGLYSAAIAAGEKLAARWGRFGFYWSFSAWVPAVFLPAPFNIAFGIMDGVVAGYIAFATHLLAAYSPTSIKSCRGTGAHDFQLPPGANESFFDAAARLNASATDSFHMCKSFVQEWQYGVALSTIYGLISFLNVTFCIYACLNLYRDSQRNNTPLWKSFLHSTHTFSKIVGFVLFAVVYYAWALLFRFLPVSIKSRVRFARRYGLKAGQGLGEKSEMQMKALKKKFDRGGEKRIYEVKNNGEPTGLAEFLGIYDMLISVVEHLHYVDVVNLGLVSRSVRAAILPNDAYAQRMVHFKMYTCHRKSKKECWVCLNQVCKKCAFPRAVKQTNPCFHLDVCRPYCTNCYFTVVQQRTNIDNTNRALDPRNCKCAPATPTPNIFQRWWRGTTYYTSRQQFLPSIARHICIECNRLDDKQLLEKRLQRTKWELKGAGGPRKRRENTEKCRYCEGELGNGPRWWVCKNCTKECRSVLHGAWGSEKKSKSKGGEVVGEQAV